MLQARSRSLFLISMACLSAACTPTSSRVLLLPQEGTRSAVMVTTAATSTELVTPYAVAEVGREGRLASGVSNAAEVRERYPTLLTLLPPSAERFTLNFEPGTSSLTPESTARLDGIIAAARARSGGEIVIVGHTDRQGDADANDALSLRRAIAVRDVLVQRGFQSALIEPVGRGEREPVMPTEDGVPEPLNRRADIIVR